MANLRRASLPVYALVGVFLVAGGWGQAVAAVPNSAQKATPLISAADRLGVWDAGGESDGYTILWTAKDGRSITIACSEEGNLRVAFDVPGRPSPQGQIVLGKDVYSGTFDGGSGSFEFSPKEPRGFLKAIEAPGRLAIEASPVYIEPVEPPPEMRAWFVRRCAEYWPEGSIIAKPKPNNLTDQAPPAFAAARDGSPVKQRVFRDQIGLGFLGPEMVALPPGVFLMGSPKGEGYDDERPQRSIRLERQLAVSKYEVTWEEYNLCHYEGPCPAPPDDGFGGGRRPVTNVSYDDAKTYAVWLSSRTGQRYSLLSEAEWEFAARAGSTTTFPWGPTLLPNKADCDGCGSAWDARSTAPVGSFSPNAFGLYDLLGNVWEWVADCSADSYAAGQPRNGSAFLPKECSTRVNRGGSWNTTPSRLRSANRLPSDPKDRVKDLGFRVARH